MCSCALITEAPRSSTQIYRASRVFNHTIQSAAWALRLRGYITPHPQPHSARVGYCLVVVVVVVVPPPQRGEAFIETKNKDAERKQRRHAS